MATKRGIKGAPEEKSKKSSRTSSILGKLVLQGEAPGYEEEHRSDEPGVIWMDIDRIHPSPFQHEEYIDPAEFQALVQSMKESPYPFALNVNEMDDGTGDVFLTAGGHQRVKAAKAAGRMKMAVFLEPPLSRFELAMRALRENAVQVNRSRVNMGHLFKHMLTEFKSEGLTQEKIAEALGDKGRSFVEYCILAADSLPIIQALVNERPDSVKVMLYLRRIKPQIKDPGRTEPTQEEIAEAEALLLPIVDGYKSGLLTAKDVELEVRKVQNRQQGKGTTEDAANPTPTEEFAAPSRLQQPSGSEEEQVVAGQNALQAFGPGDSAEGTGGETYGKPTGAAAPLASSAVVPCDQEGPAGSGNALSEKAGTGKRIRRVGRAETARGALFSYKKIAPTTREELTPEELALLDEIFCTSLVLLDPELAQYLENFSTRSRSQYSFMKSGEKPRLVEILRALLLRKEGHLPDQADDS